MPAYYLDTSALVKRYITENGTTWVTALANLAAENELFTSQISGPELVSAVSRRARAGDLGPREAPRAISNFRKDWVDQYLVVETGDEVIDRAMRLAEKHALRGADSIHVSAALELHFRREAMRLPPLTFVSADVEQLAAAQAEGLPTENPTVYL